MRRTIDCKIKRRLGGKLPTKGTPKSACYDLYAREIKRVESEGGLYKVSLGVHMEPEHGYRVAIYPRSSISGTGWVLANSVGVGDEDYRGEYLAYFRKVKGDAPFPYTLDDRVCQMELVEWNDINFTVVDELSDTERGEGGFGSTGKSD